MDISAKKTLDGKRDYLPVARTLRDKLDGLITSGAMDLGTQRKMLFDVSKELDLVLANEVTHRYDQISTDTHSCCEHEQVTNPALWSTLPMELLHRVFAKLPFPNICRLKSLSKEWQLSLQSSSSEFTLALKESSPTILARVSSYGQYSFWLHVLDGRNNRWHALHVYVDGGPTNSNSSFLSVVGWKHMRGAADAGLVCYVCKDFKTGLNSIFVINPLTGVFNRPPIVDLCSNPTMMQIIVDRTTYHYKVLVVKHGPPVEAEVYDSEIQQWTKPNPSLGRILGIAHYWRRDGHPDELGPCAYDCRDGKYNAFRQEQLKWDAEEVISYTVTKDRLFVLYWEKKEDAAFISEYYLPENATSWVKEETHKCFPRAFRSGGRGDEKMTGGIYACNGFLYVFQNPYSSQTRFEKGWVYNLATCEWRALSRVPWWSNGHLDTFSTSLDTFSTSVMCELHWSIQP